MQFNDAHWKRELEAFSSAISRAKVTRASSHDEIFSAERPILYSAFVVRKLIEDTAVTNRLKSRSVDLQSFPSTRNGRSVFLETMLGPLDVEKQFDIAKPRAIRMSIYDLASEIVHADGLIWNLANDPSESFGVFSYQNFLNRMIEVPIPVYLDVLNQVIRDKPEIWFQEEDITTGKIKRHAVTKREYAQPTKLTKPGGGSK